jgi:hypothetical protein
MERKHEVPSRRGVGFGRAAPTCIEDHAPADEVTPQDRQGFGRIATARAGIERPELEPELAILPCTEVLTAG